ncbi:MAG: M20/M25/M40 family metallo-hydrolase [Anaerolineae bacterium]|jgi:acetylornithine deacetylase/succinyl-diaminopimelate desuccinylase-like protein
MNREAIYRYIDDHLDDHIAHIQKWVRQPSVSWDSLGTREAAELTAQSYRDLGCQEVEVLEGRYHPGVWAVYDAGAPLTVHNYCMIDTRTVDVDAWTYDPWGGELVQIGPYPQVLVGRGAMGAKGPYVAWLNALAAIIAVEGTLPMNIMFLAETEEIMGSPSYNDFIQRYAGRLKNVDASFCPACTQSPGGVVSVGLGLKGMVVVELTASGASWGKGPTSTVHSSVASLVDCPPFRLAQALSTLTDDEGRGCEVEGLKQVWDYRKPLPADERELLDRLVDSVQGRDWRDVIPMGGAGNVAHVVGGQEGSAPLINYLYGPTFNVAGLRSGFLGPETGTIPYIVPSEATATLDIRLVVDLSPAEVIAALRQHLDRHGFLDIDIEVYAAFGHNQTPVTDPGVQATLQTLRDWNVEASVWPIQAGGGPWTAVPNAFGVPCIRGGAIGGGGRGNVDEYMVIEGDGKVAGLADVEKYLVDLVYAFCQQEGA